MVAPRFPSLATLTVLLLTACAVAPASRPQATATSTPVAVTGTVSAPTARQTAPALAFDALVPVTAIVDGDTIKVSLAGGEETVRIIGVDTPELDGSRGPRCFGVEATAKTRELLAGQRIRLVPDSTQGDRDKFGRLLRYVELADGLDFGLYLIERGYAHEYTYNTPYRRQAAYRAAEGEAKAKKRGFWAPDTCDGNTEQPAR